GLHASAIFDSAGKIIVLREDVGRHNAVDKVIGTQLIADNLPLSDKILFLSGRVSFELIQKAAMAGIPIICAVGAPSSLAVGAAKEFNMTLLGFVRDNRFNIYAEPERVLSSSLGLTAGIY
ncbi:MAG TPA: formate dehydrogenase accessory sulfurtransferase FdhD, partial [Chitinophagaceae bacterium]